MFLFLRLLLLHFFSEVKKCDSPEKLELSLSLPQTNGLDNWSNKAEWTTDVQAKTQGCDLTVQVLCDGVREVWTEIPTTNQFDAMQKFVASK